MLPETLNLGQRNLEDVFVSASAGSWRREHLTAPGGAALSRTVRPRPGWRRG